MGNKDFNIDENYYVGNVLSIEANRIRIIMKKKIKIILMILLENINIQ